MAIATLKSDTEIKTDVLSELKYEPSVKVADVGVTVKSGVVTVNGYVTTYGEKWDTVRAVKRVSGVKAIADEIEVKLPDFLNRTDGEIAGAVNSQIDWSTTIPQGTVAVTVTKGQVTLEGSVEWSYQRSRAEAAVIHLSGVKGVNNRITIKPRVSVSGIEDDVKAAFERNALLDAAKVEVEADGGSITLRGTVRNHAERDEAERVAWAAPGVWAVENKLGVEWSWLTS